MFRILLKVYLLPLFFILGWWLIAFGPIASINPQKTFKSPRKLVDVKQAFQINRELLLQALGGNYHLMLKLISEWDSDAQLMIKAGFSEIQRTDFSALLQFRPSDITHVFDDTGRQINIEYISKKYLPQTYTAASFLLALCSPEEIVALPRHMREQIQLYPKPLTDQIPLDIDRYHSEKLFNISPEIAFVSHYSHPATLQALSEQNITLYTIKNLNSLQDISDELLNIGFAVKKSVQAHLLNLFIHSAMTALDNKLKVSYSRSSRKPQILYLNYHQTFSIPSPNSLIGELLKRTNAIDLSSSYLSEKNLSQEWAIPIDKEQILYINPDYLIIATENKDLLEEKIYADHAFQHLSALESNQVYFVDEAVQQSQSQYFVLAYYDLVSILDTQ